MGSAFRKFVEGEKDDIRVRWQSRPLHLMPTQFCFLRFWFKILVRFSRENN